MSKKDIYILVGCEESQEVTKAFRALGFSAFSCDLIECSGNRPEWHLQMSVFDAIKLREWDLGIFFPPCTRLTVTGNKWYKPEYKNRFPNILQEREDAIIFFLKIANSNIHRLAIENPIGIMSTVFRKPDQIIHPYYFGDTERKSTCLWLKNLPKINHSVSDNLFFNKTHVAPEIIYHKSGNTDSKFHFDSLSLPKEERTKVRSKTFPGIANAMANQWGEYLTRKLFKKGN